MIVLSDKPLLLLMTDLKDHHIKELEDSLAGFELIRTIPEDKRQLSRIEIVVGWTKELTELWQQGDLISLKWIQAISAGVNSLPLDSLREHGVMLTNASGIHKDTISEHVIGLILYHARSFNQIKLNQQNNHWDQAISVQQLEGKTAIIFGIGNIGRRLATLLKAFGVHTIGVNTRGNKVAEVDQTVSQEESNRYLEQADYVINILPQTDETKGFFNSDRFKAMKKGTAFFNVGRGNTVDTEALLTALDSNQLAFAALDVFETEPLEADSPLWQHDRIFITPHVSGMVEHFRDALFSVVGPNAQAYGENGKPSLNMVDYEKRY